MATFRKRSGPAGKIVWQAQIVRIGERQKHGTFDTTLAAQEWARQVENLMDRREWVDRTEGERTLLSMALERYEREILPGKAPSARVAERNRLQALSGCRVARIALTKIGGADVAEFLRERLDEGVSANTIRVDLAPMTSHCLSTAMASHSVLPACDSSWRST